MKTKAILLLLASFAFLSGCVSKPAVVNLLDDWELDGAIAADDVDFVAKRLRDISPNSLLFDTPLLYWATSKNAVGVMELLLRKGADKEQRIGIDEDSPGPRILEFYLEYKTNVNERIVALLQRNRLNTPQEDIFELFEEAILNSFYSTNVAFRVESDSVLPPSADMAKLQKALIKKGYPLSRNSKDTGIVAVWLNFEKVDENTYIADVWRYWEEHRHSAFKSGKLEKRYGYWMWTTIDHVDRFFE